MSWVFIKRLRRSIEGLRQGCRSPLRPLAPYRVPAVGCAAVAAVVFCGSAPACFPARVDRFVRVGGSSS